jgi:hypothetical protein
MTDLDPFRQIVTNRVVTLGLPAPSDLRQGHGPYEVKGFLLVTQSGVARSAECWTRFILRIIDVVFAGQWGWTSLLVQPPISGLMFSWSLVG